MLQRLQKIIAQAGVTSRRKAEELIVGGRVTVDGEVVRELGAKADPDTNEVCVDGERLEAERKAYVALNKPVGVICTNLDELARRTAVELVDVKQRLYCVGRLDEHSEGLLILTNDGEFAQKLTHPKYGVRKTYLARVEGELNEPDLEKIRKGIWLAEGRTQAAEVAVKKRLHGVSLALITLREGKNREVRRIFARLGHKVFTLRRIRIGTLAIGSLKPGQWRRLAGDEVRSLLGEARAGSFGPRPSFSGANSGGTGPSERAGQRGKPRGGPRGANRPARRSGPPRRPGRAPERKRR